MDGIIPHSKSDEISSEPDQQWNNNNQQIPSMPIASSSYSRSRTISQSSVRLPSSSPLLQDPSTPPPNPPASLLNDEGYLDVSAKWGGEGETRTNAAARSSRMIGNRIGVSPPPPPGPPPSDPPPLPPAPSSHPFATSSSSSSSSRPRPSARLSSLSSLRKANLMPTTSRPASPAGPPPMSDLPPLPIPSRSSSSSTPPKESSSSFIGGNHRPNHTRQSSRSKLERENSSQPTVSPRSSSLFNVNNNNSQPGPSGTSTANENLGLSLGTPISLGKRLPEQPLLPSQPQPSQNSTAGPSQSQSQSSKPPRTPSRHLLQTALDLAQKAVEMDKNNDVLGALAAYREAVSRLKAVMERVGVEPSGDKKSGKRGKSEEEGRTLRGIHDAYVARIQLLSSYETNPEAEPSSQAGPSSSSSSTASHPPREQHLRPTHSTNPSTSTATLVPPITEGTPRPSLDDGGMTGIGNLMLADHGDQSFDSSALSPQRPKPSESALPQSALGSPPSLREHAQVGDTQGQNLSMNGDSSRSLISQQAPDQPPSSSSSGSIQRGSIPSIGLGYPTSPPNMTHPSTHTSTPMRTQVSSHSVSSETDNSPSSSRSRLKKPNRPSMGLDMEADLTGIDGVDEGGGEVEMLARTPRESHMPSSLGSTSSISLVGSKERRSSNQSQSRRSKVPDSPQSMKSDIDRPLPPLPNSASSSIMENHNNQPVIGSRKTSLTNTSKPLPTPVIAPTSGLLVSPTTTQGTISQRRQSRPISGTLSTLFDPSQSQTQNQINHPQQSDPKSSSSQFPVSSSNSSIRSTSQSSVGTRIRAKSQPGQRPIANIDQSGGSATGSSFIPPVPANQLRHKSSFSSSSHLGIGILPQVSRQSLAVNPGNGLRIETNQGYSSTGGLAPPAYITNRTGSGIGISPRSLPPLPDTALTATSGGGGMGGSLISPLPETQPLEVLHRPFHILRILHSSMDPESNGSYLTGSIHISSSIWNSSNYGGGGRTIIPPPKIIAQEIKIRCLENLILHFESIRITGQGLLSGPRDKKRIDNLQITNNINNNKLAEEFCLTLDELHEEMDNSHKILSNNGVGLVGWKGKKHSGTTKSWGSRISRSMDKMTNSNKHTNDKLGMEGTDKYVDLLANLCLGAQVINEHLLNFTSGECTNTYSNLNEKAYRNIESRLRRTAEFIGTIIVPFVLDDFKQFLLRFLKGGVRYLED